MSIHAYSIVYIGKTFETEAEALHFLTKKNIFTTDEEEEIENHIETGYSNLEEHLMNKKLTKFPDVGYLNYSTGEGYFIGYLFYIHGIIADPILYAKEADECKEQWEKLFNEEAEVNDAIQYK